MFLNWDQMKHEIHEKLLCPEWQLNGYNDSAESNNMDIQQHHQQPHAYFICFYDNSMK